MQRINADNSIYLTRGDSIIFDVKAKVNDGDGNERPYTFQPGDTVRFTVYKKKSCSDVEIVKDFVVAYESPVVQIYLSGDETKIGKVINKPTDYWYDVEIVSDGDTQTIIGYTDNGPSLFKLFPEGSKV